LGAVKPQKVDLRLCSATHQPLRDRVSEGAFREDLFFRIGRPAVALPALRERPEEIPWLVESLLGDGAPPPHVSLVAAAPVRARPGNLRELALEIREAARAAQTESAETIEVRYLDAEAGMRGGASQPAATVPLPSREDLEAALARSSGNVSKTAQALGVHRT